jgi:hypothetical protein
LAAVVARGWQVSCGRISATDRRDNFGFWWKKLLRRRMFLDGDLRFGGSYQVGSVRNDTESF